MRRLRFDLWNMVVALTGWGLALQGAPAGDSVELRFQIDEYVDFGLEEPRISFIVDHLDLRGETLLHHFSRYHLLSNCDSPRRVVASLSTPLPGGTSLELELASPSPSSISLGPRRLDLGPVELLQGVGKVHRHGVRLIYTFRADFTAPVGVVSPTITFSVVP